MGLTYHQAVELEWEPDQPKMKSLITLKNLRALFIATGDKAELFDASRNGVKVPSKAALFLFQNKRFTRPQFEKLLRKRAKESIQVG